MYNPGEGLHGTMRGWSMLEGLQRPFFAFVSSMLKVLSLLPTLDFSSLWSFLCFLFETPSFSSFSSCPDLAGLFGGILDVTQNLSLVLVLNANLNLFFHSVLMRKGNPFLQARERRKEISRTQLD